MPVLIGFLVVFLTIYLLQSFTRASPVALARFIKSFGGVLLLFLGAFLFLRGALGIALACWGLGVWIMGLGGFSASGFRSAGAGGAGVSRVRSAMIEMELDRATGAIRGVILAGPQEGKRLDSLTRPQLIELYKICLTDDPEGARLLEAYLDRRFAGWRGAGQGQQNARSGASGGGGGSRRGSITEDEAYEILGLKKGAPASEIARAHRDLMKKLHPDHGGTTDLAARVNEAKDVLMRRHHG
ncbi:J domain-containing protein [Methylocystis heyeri]|uniref:DnaJ domain-containing protein n=1 Tax=Methylocystis heyeri TaxID=391905 RepID=A0A6B8KEE8_9HYPH|nr:DnaJ domain-containing protein [Methylocystis heyeri]QGM44948.1 DnaJ domain-containing protein [Methylocystis heyeri]